MGKRLRFFWKSTGDDAPSGLEFFVLEDGSVWRDNYRTCESQSAVVGFDDFVMPCPEIDWEIVQSHNT